jgi:hypothetical protein
METPMTKTEVAVATPADNEKLPAYLQGNGPIQNEDNFDQSDITLPRIKLLQTQSTEMQTYPGIAKLGHFWHTGMDIDLGPQIRFIVCDRRKKYLLVAPITDGQGILARADDALTWDKVGKFTVKIKNVKEPQVWEIKNRDVAASGLTDWGTSVPSDEDSPPAATLFYDYLVLLPDHPDFGPAVISLARSSIKPAKKGLNDKIAMHGSNGRPMQALMFDAVAVSAGDAGQEYQNWMFKSAGFVQDEKLFKTAQDYRGALANIIVDQEATVANEGEAGPADTGAGNF